MKIELDFPFNKDWKYGYIRESKKDKRKRVDLFNSNENRTTISYARYIISTSLGRYLSSDEEVDHIDGDKTNDDLENLQILTKQMHLEKTLKDRPKRKIETLICANCGIVFNRFSNQIKKNKVANHFCSRHCNGKFYSNKTS